MARILVVDDDEVACRLVRAMLGPSHDVTFAHDGASGLERALSHPPDLLILDLELPGLHGLLLLEQLKAQCPDLPVVMLTATAELRAAIRATQLGASDYLTKPVDSDALTAVVHRALELGALRTEVRSLRRRVAGVDSLSEHMGPSDLVREIEAQVATVAGTDFSVLLLGETGTGKELVAQTIHRRSSRSSGPFVALDCGAIPDSLLESYLFGHERGAFTGAHRRNKGQLVLAEGGTLFLDEIGNLPLSLQAKLLRVLESRRLQAIGADRPTAVDVRFLAATNQDLEERVQARAFRADLYFRLAQYTITLPPLRARPEDIEHLVRRFLAEIAVELRRPTQVLSKETVALLQRHSWQGNVRELRNVIRRAVLESNDEVIGRSIMKRLFKLDAGGPTDQREPIEGLSLRELSTLAAREAEQSAIVAALRRTRGNKSRAARLLRTDYKTLHLKMRALGIRAAEFDGPGAP